MRWGYSEFQFSDTYRCIGVRIGFVFPKSFSDGQVALAFMTWAANVTVASNKMNGKWFLDMRYLIRSRLAEANYISAEVKVFHIVIQDF
jgi:hypothetical protein